MKYPHLLNTLLSVLLTFGLFAQSTGDVEFGKNRVQFHKDFEEWSEYNSDNFTVYWYGEGRYVGEATVLLAEYDFKSIEELLEHRMNDRVEIIVYSDLTDLKQSNIGLEDAFENTDGLTKIEGNKVFVYFNGDHTHLRRQIRQGIAGVYLHSMAIGSNLQEMVQNAVMLQLPTWFEQGLISFIGEEWNTAIDNELRNVFAQDQYKNFDKFAEEEPVLAGHAFWYYINQKFGKSSLTNLLYLIRINRDLEAGFTYVIGSSLESIKLAWKSYFEERYKEERSKGQIPTREGLAFKNKRNIPITQLKISPNGQYIAFVTNEIGKTKVHLYDLYSDKTEMIFKSGFRNAFQATDYNYPLLAWSPTSFELAILYEKQDLARLIRYDINTQKQVEDDLSIQLQRVYSMDYTDPRTLLMSATSRGFSDLFLYNINARQPRAITRDYYDDLDAQFVEIGNKRGVLWASNRPDSLVERTKMDSLPPIAQFDLFYYDLEKKGTEAVRITNTPFANERQAIMIDTTHFSYLSDESGVYNRYVGYLEDYIAFYERVIELKDGDEIVMHIDSTLEKLDTALIDSTYTRPVVKQRAINRLVSNYASNILEQSQATRRNRSAELLLVDNKYQIYLDTIRPTAVVARPVYTTYRAEWARKSAAMAIDNSALPNVNALEEETLPEEIPEIEEVPQVQEEKEKEEEEESTDYFFQSEFDDEEKEETEEVLEEETKEVVVQEEEKVEEEEEVDVPSFEPIEVKEEVAENEYKGYKFNPGKIIPYRLKFRVDDISTQMDNEQLFGGLNTYSGMPEDFGYPPPGILLKAKFTDLLEDYHIVGGVRVPTSFNGTEYFLYFDNNKRRLDKRFAFYRRNLRFPSSVVSPNNNLNQIRRDEIQNILGQFTLRYPLDIYRSLRLKTTLRMDVATTLVTDSQVLNIPPQRENRIGLGLEYVFDNTLDVDINIKNGTRYKVYAESVKRFDLSLSGESDLQFREGFMTILGFDFRHYQRLDRKSILAFRAAGATSFGSERILFRIGGTDNWIIPQFNENIPQPRGENFAYRVDMTNLRGFPLNIRNGSSFALVNTELRVPIFRYLLRTPRPFLRNFQAVAFADAGTAWSGPSPFTEESPLNTSTFSNGPVTVKVNYFRDPIVVGYGGGVRVVLFGYFLRVDRAWGIETRTVQPGRWFISLGTDF
ncbi:MAG: hypothetical protein AAF849_11320 [Bacteroidota bacterium]